MVIDEDSVPLVASLNLVATDLKEMLNANNYGRFSLNAKIRKV